MMAVLRASFCQQQIVVAIPFVDVRSLRITSAKTRSQMVNLAQLLTRLYVNLTYLDVALLPQKLALIILPIERGVAAADGEVNYDRL